jgi:hypothetical protein
MKTKTAIKIFLGFIIASLLLVIIGINIDGGVTNQIQKLSATVRYNNSQFLIANTGEFDWSNVEMKVNKKYTLAVDKIEAYGTYTVGMGQFADSSGNRFNVFTMKPLNISIHAKEGYSYFTLE